MQISQEQLEALQEMANTGAKFLKDLDKQIHEYLESDKLSQEDKKKLLEMYQAGNVPEQLQQVKEQIEKLKDKL